MIVDIFLILVDNPTRRLANCLRHEINKEDVLLEKEEFDSKFKKLIELLMTDTEICDKFVQFPTISGSYRFVCSLVGELDLEMYEKAIKDFIGDSDLSEVSGGNGISNYNELFVDNLVK